MSCFSNFEVLNNYCQAQPPIRHLAWCTKQLRVPPVLHLHTPVHSMETGQWHQAYKKGFEFWFIFKPCAYTCKSVDNNQALGCLKTPNPSEWPKALSSTVPARARRASQGNRKRGTGTVECCATTFSCSRRFHHACKCLGNGIWQLKLDQNHKNELV